MPPSPRSAGASAWPFACLDQRCEPVELAGLASGGDAAAVAGAEAVFIAVGTPTRRGDGHADLTYVMAAAAEISAISEVESASSSMRLIRLS